MTTKDPDSPVRRMAMAIGAAAVIMVAAGLVYYFIPSKEAAVKFNGAAIVAAARDYTRNARLRKEPLPRSITLDELISLHYLSPEQGEAFHGAKAMVMLSTDERGPKAVVMEVQMPDGSALKLFNDGSVLESSR